MLRDEGIRWLDFRGIDPKGNPGGYVFKTGLTGKKGMEVFYLGDFVHYHGNLARLLITAAEKVNSRYQLTKSMLRRSHRPAGE